jgi:hypothetical protein
MQKTIRKGLAMSCSKTERESGMGLPSGSVSNDLTRTLSSKELARLITVGMIEIPKDLHPEGFRELLIELRRLRQERFIRLIAESIARDIQSQKHSTQ